MSAHQQQQNTGSNYAINSRERDKGAQVPVEETDKDGSQGASKAARCC